VIYSSREGNREKIEVAKQDFRYGGQNMDDKKARKREIR